MLILPRKYSNITDLTISPVNGGIVSRLYGGALSFGYLPPGGESKTLIVQLKVGDAAWISNIRLSIVTVPENMQMEFKVGVLDYLDEAFEPEDSFPGIDFDASGKYYISIKNISNTESQYVYLKTKCLLNSNIGTGAIFYSWTFEHDKYLQPIIPAIDDNSQAPPEDVTNTPPVDGTDTTPNQPNGSIYVPPFFMRINGLADIFASAKQIGTELGATLQDYYSDINFELFGGLKFSGYYKYPPEYTKMIRIAQNQTTCPPTLNCYFTLSQKIVQGNIIVEDQWVLVVYIGYIFTNDYDLAPRAIYELNNSTTANGLYNLVSSEAGRPEMANAFPATINVSVSTLDEIKTNEATLKSTHASITIVHQGMQLFE